MKIHLGCGNIYLKKYINIDANPKFLAKEVSKEILEKNITTFENYYKYEFCKGPLVCIADIKSKINSLPFENNSVDEAVLIQVLEHIPSYEISAVLDEINRVLKINGKFIVGVPDLKKTAEMLAKAKTDEEEDWCIRLIHGTQRNEFSHHFCGYTERTLKNILLKHNFNNFELLHNINFYPSIYIKTYKV
jgi:SAM-dependent methyltransferase